MNDATRLLAKARRALTETYGFADFRPGQEEILAAAFAGEDVLAVMPTGAGKSLCYQLPALARGGLTLVVSPLIALMRDQVAQLDALGISAAALNSAAASPRACATGRSGCSMSRPSGCYATTRSQR
jgi:ATP-dependent DNA helicase RecQ